MKEFNVGDKVIVTDAGRNYPTYKEWVEKNAPAYLERWVNRSREFPNDILYNKKSRENCSETSSFNIVKCVFVSNRFW